MSFWRQNVWEIPDSPDADVYREVIDDINATTDEKIARGKFRLICEADFWFYLRYASTFGNFVISDTSHPRYGTLWAEHPWVFDRCRDIQTSWDARESGVFWNWSRYHFKALDLETPVPTPDGWRRHGDLREGDRVFAADGSAVKIIGTSEVFYKECYEVCFDNGESIIASGDHLWGLEIPSGRRLPEGGREGRRYEVWPTSRIAEYRHDAGRRLHIRRNGAVEYPEKDLPIDPYVLGAWLGDGSTSGGRVHNVDEGVWEEIRKAGYELGDFHDKAQLTRTVYGLQKQLRALGMLGHKHIPEIYMQSSVDQRMAFLQGLMDTDGSANKVHHQVSFCTSLAPFAEQFRELLWSLGFKNGIHSRENGFKGHHLISFYARKSEGVFRLQRKLDLCDDNESRRKRDWRAITAVNPVGKRECSCIMVDHSSGLYLAGKSFVPTHNTSLITGHHTVWALLRDPKETFLLLTFKVDETGESMYDVVRDELEKNGKLKAHWPDVLTDAAIKGFTKKSLTVNRPLGPKEPSVSLHSLDKLPTSFHGSSIKVDDAVVRETVRSQLMIDSTLEAMKALTFVGSDDTVKWWIGTIWDQSDPYMRSLADGRFTRRDWWTPYFKVEGDQNSPPVKPEGAEPALRSEKMLREWEKEVADPYVWSCQMWGWPVAREQQVFDVSWLTRYRNEPRVEREGKAIHIFVDTAGGGRDGDYTVVYVQGLGDDKLRYSLDLWREKWTLVDLIDNLFVIVKYWSKERPVERVWVEQVWDKGTLVAIQQEMEHRLSRFKIKALPDNKKPKKERIKLLQAVQRRGEIVWPENGFGHGSVSTKDRRDTMQQLIEDEYRLWTPMENSVLHDDMLDAVAWSIQPDVKVRFPEDHVRHEGADSLFPALDNPYEGVSPWVTL